MLIELKLYEPKIKNEDGTGSGIGDYIDTIFIDTVSEIYFYMEKYNIPQVYAKTVCGQVNVFYLNKKED